ncbi:endonuclease III [Candidatus Peregrinibacteria bacterium]|nr:endonuclease III [Candidatus Peregrinibacteria bacterium]
MKQNEKLTAVAVFCALKKAYHPPRTFLSWKTPLDLLVATILSAQCTDARVNIVTKTLYKKYRSAEDYVKVSRKILERDIHSCGTYRNKARFLQEMCAQLIEKHHGKVPQTMEELVQLRGVGRKTAAIILWTCFGRNEGIAVDTHVIRVAQRLGLSCHKDPKKIERDLMESLPRKKWGEFTTLVISHGRAVCTARNRQCQKCQFGQRCPSSSKLGKNDLAKA